jgi:hypothetical protein
MRSFVPQRFNRIEQRGFACWIPAEEHTDTRRETKSTYLSQTLSAGFVLEPSRSFAISTRFNPRPGRQFIGPSNLMPFERRHETLLSRRLFLWRLARWSAVAGAVVLGSLAIGVCGYHYLGSLPWVDSLLNASMILGGMGPVDPMKSNAAKIFASMYALYSGLALIAVVGLLLAPVIHRFLHKFHIADG